MATRALKHTFRPRPKPYNRISIRGAASRDHEAKFKEFVRRRVLQRGSLHGSPARLLPRIHDTRLQGPNSRGKGGGSESQETKILEATKRSRTVWNVPNPDATISSIAGLDGSLPPNFHIFLTLDLSQYVPRSKLDGPKLLHVDWYPASSARDDPILGDQEYRILKRLAITISNATQNPGKFNKELLRLLKQAQTFPSVIQYLTPAAWEAFFAYERKTMPTNLTIFVAEMMDIHGVKRTEKQECDLIGAIFWNRDRTEATQHWVNFMRSLIKPTAVTWNLGIKLLSLRKEPQRAMSIYNVMKESLGYTDPKALIPIILSWNHLYQCPKAWSVFQDLKQIINRDPNCVKPSHLEDIALSFMDAGKPAASFSIWRYMWKKGMAVPEYTKEAAIFYQSIIQTPQVLHTFSSNLLDALKDRVSDKYFYASWMKNLIRLGRPDLTLQVKEVMESNGLRPDAQHVNEIIRGFLKDGYGGIAEGLARELIHQRLQKVASWAEAIEQKKCRKEAQPFGVSVDSLPPELQDPKSPLQVIEEKLNTPPMATPQTFSILLHYFTRKRDYKKAQDYMDLMIQCQTPVSAVHFNHLLKMYLRQSELGQLQKTFEIMTRQLGCKPDRYTWGLMWYAMWKRYTQPKRRASSFQTPRQLFAEMVKFIPITKHGDPSPEWESPESRATWKVIIRCFMLARDWDGLIVALNAGDSLWKLHVNEGVYKEVALGLLKKGKPGLVCDESGRISKRKISEEMVNQAIHELGTLERNISIKTKVMRLSSQEDGPDEKKWAKAMEKIRRIPIEEASAGLEAVTTVLKQEAGNMDSMVGVGRLKDVREEMGLKHVGIKGTLPPSTSRNTIPYQAWVSNLY
ncbi:hypothetical protein BGX38DRAFT_71468 [Terfezia claveryi]|nr:hypothetical protein BGX38DRAFT_71468 [Terfezia claveryi]